MRARSRAVLGWSASASATVLSETRRALVPASNLISMTPPLASPRPVLMSFQPEWAESVLIKGTRYELRRARCGCEPGTPVLVYTSGKVRKITGVFTVGEVLSGHPQDMWADIAGECGVGWDDYQYYLNGLDTGWAIEVLRPRLIEPVALGFRGPMSFRYLNADEPDHARLLAAAGL